MYILVLSCFPLRACFLSGLSATYCILATLEKYTYSVTAKNTHIQSQLTDCKTVLSDFNWVCILNVTKHAVSRIFFCNTGPHQLHCGTRSMQAVVSKTFVWNLLAAINRLPRNDFSEEHCRDIKVYSCRQIRG